MLAKDRTALLGSLLQVQRAAQKLILASTDEQQRAAAWSTPGVDPSHEPRIGWTANAPSESARVAIRRGAQVSLEHMEALFVLARHKSGFSVALAAVTRAALEAFGRVFWLAEADSIEEVLRRLASQEFYDLKFPVRNGKTVTRFSRVHRSESTAADYRQSIGAWATQCGIKLEELGPGAAARLVLDRSHTEPQAGIIYSDLSAVAHGQGGATANFYDYTTRTLRLDEQQLIEYSLYLIEAARVVADAIAERFGVGSAAVGAWAAVNSSVDERLNFIRPSGATQTD